MPNARYCDYCGKRIRYGYMMPLHNLGGAAGLQGGLAGRLAVELSPGRIIPRSV